MYARKCATDEPTHLVAALRLLAGALAAAAPLLDAMTAPLPALLPLPGIAASW